MRKRTLNSFLPHIPTNKLALKIVLGVFCLTFLLDYQPVLGFPPIKKNTIKAQTTEQTQTISAKEVPFPFQLPHPGYLSTFFSSYHPGIDLATGLGMPIHPIASGTVVEAGYDFWGLGLKVEVDHGAGYKSTYAHMGKIYVKKGQSVSKDDLLGEVGLTGNTSGPHTHLEIAKDNVKINPTALLPEIRKYPIAADLTPVPKGGGN